MASQQLKLIRVEIASDTLLVDGYVEAEPAQGCEIPCLMIDSQVVKMARFYDVHSSVGRASYMRKLGMVAGSSPAAHHSNGHVGYVVAASKLVSGCSERGLVRHKLIAVMQNASNN